MEVEGANPPVGGTMTAAEEQAALEVFASVLTGYGLKAISEAKKMGVETRKQTKEVENT